MPKLQALRWELTQAQAIIPRIEGMATLYQPALRRLCGETTYHLAVALTRRIIQGHWQRNKSPTTTPRRSNLGAL